jgi:hypothetical protein
VGKTGTQLHLPRKPNLVHRTPPFAFLQVLCFLCIGAADQRTAEQARMSGMQVETVRKAAGNSSGGGAVSLSTLRRAEDDDSDAPMKCESLL